MNFIERSKVCDVTSFARRRFSEKRLEEKGDAEKSKDKKGSTTMFAKGILAE